MTPKEFKEAMQKIADDQGGDLEACHSRMDDLMLKQLSTLGYNDGVQVFNSTEKWYA